MTSLLDDPTTDESNESSLEQRLNDVPKGTWTACPQCGHVMHEAKLRRTLRVCVGCSRHLGLGALDRIAALTDPHSFSEIDAHLGPEDALEFTDSKPYPQRLATMRDRTGRPDAAMYGHATITELPVVLCVLDFAFMGGSMGSVVGEKVTRAAELALTRGVPLITCSSSGGARMQEGILSLMQMAKSVAALRRLSDAGVPHISILSDPVYGGVTASFASYADIIIAEPGARAGFAGPRVIEQTIRQRLPAGFQTADFLLKRGHIDAIVPRAELFATLARVVAFHAATKGEPRGRHEGGSPEAVTGISADPWEAVKLARHSDRPLVEEYIDQLFSGFLELRGDRVTEDDPAVIGGIAVFHGVPVVVIGHRKGRGTADAVARNFGMPHPSGYRKARRLMGMAERFGVPLITLVDTPGAYPGLAAEENNQSGAIAENLAVLAGLRTPIVSVIVGEGGSGGALALAVADRLLMLEHATLSVISPEGCASILFGDAGQAPRAARELRLTAPDLVGLGIADEVISEPDGGAHNDARTTVSTVGEAIRRHLAEVGHRITDVGLKERYLRLRAIGRYSERAVRDSE